MEIVRSKALVNQKAWKLFFLLAAVFNFVVAIVILAFKSLYYQLLFMNEVPEIGERVSSDLFALLVGLFGIAYWRISRAPNLHPDFVWMGMCGKILVVICAWYNTFAFGANLGLSVITIADLVFAMFFAYFLYIIAPNWNS